MSDTNPPPAGWYPQDGQERWWNGSSWSDAYRPLSTPMFYQPTAPLPPSHTARNLLIVFAVLALLFIGGCSALVVVVGKRADDAFNDDTPGGPNNPLTITEGKAFEVAGFEYADGWSIGPDETGDVDVTGLRVHNARGESDYAFVTIKLLQGNEVVASVSCTGPDGTRISDDTTVTMDCSGFDAVPPAWDSVTIQDDF